MTDRAVEVDDQTADGRDHERRGEGAGERSRHDQRAGVVSAVRIEQRALVTKQATTGSRYSIAAMFTRDDEGIDRRALYQPNSGNWRNTSRVPLLQSWLRAVK